MNDYRTNNVDDLIYLDNAASSWPKPSGVSEAVARTIDKYAANPGRGAHKMSLEASRIVYNCRSLLAKLFHVADPNNIIFTKNATEAINIPLLTYLKAGDHVITTSMEHNSVIRPLEFLQNKGITYSVIPSDPKGLTDLNQIEQQLKEHSNTKLLVVSHASNVTGAILPIKQICELAEQYNVKIMLDAAQSAGLLDIPIEVLGIDFLAFPGHKGLFGPQGTGGLYISPEIELPPLLHGGTGSNSEAKVMPLVRPDRYEAGTLNTPGIAGLAVGVEFILETGLDKIKEHETQLTKYLIKELQKINNILIYGPEKEVDRAAVIPFNIMGIESNEVAYMLDKVYNIAVRGGLHCSPVGHNSINTLQQGVVRVSPGYFNTMADIDKLVDALAEIVEEIF